MQEQEYDYMRPVLSVEGIKSRRSSPVEVIPVVDMLDSKVSPLDAYLGLKKAGARSFLFESADLGGKSALFSFVGSTDSTIAVKDGAGNVTQTAYEATLKVANTTQNLSLLDFLK